MNFGKPIWTTATRVSDPGSANFNKFYYDADTTQTRPATGDDTIIETDNTMNQLNEACMTITPKDGTEWSSGGGFIADSADCDSTALVFCRMDAQEKSETLPATNAFTTAATTTTETSTNTGTKFICQVGFIVLSNKIITVSAIIVAFLNH